MKRSYSSDAPERSTVRHRRTVSPVIFPVMLSLLATLSATAHATNFVREIVTPSTFNPVIAVDLRGMPHVVHGTGGNLKHTFPSGALWETEDVTPGAIGWSLAIGPDDVAHVGFFRTSSGEVYYAVRTETGWSAEFVGDPGGYSGAGVVSIEIDHLGVPHLLYGGADTNLYYAERSTGAWVVEQIDLGGGTADSGGSLALDDLGRPHVAFEQRNLIDLKYAVRLDTGWMIELVDAAPSPGTAPSLAFDPSGVPHICFRGTGVEHAWRESGTWVIETVENLGGSAPVNFSLAIDAGGTLNVCYYDFDASRQDLRYGVSPAPGVWSVESIDEIGPVGLSCTLALDPAGNPHVAYLESDGVTELRYATTAARLLTPGGGETWPVGALREVTWRSAAPVDIALSVDGGATFEVLASQIMPGGGAPGARSYQLRVPHRPTRFSVLEVRQLAPVSTSCVDSFLTIDASITLLRMAASTAPGGAGLRVEWSTRPGPEDLAGYRVERSRAGGEWMTIVPFVRDTEILDDTGRSSDRYRLHAINGWGEEIVVGEAGVVGLAPLHVWPLPLRAGGTLHIRFGHSAIAGSGAARVDLFDVRGRVIRNLSPVVAASPAGSLLWDGRDATGRIAPAGVYFLRLARAEGNDCVKVLVE